MAKDTKRNRGGWTSPALEYLGKIQAILENFKEYWPLTLRQIYYQLVKDFIIENKKNEYKKLSEILSKARLEGLVLWESMEDRSRSLLKSGGYDDKNHFIENETNVYLTKYRRDLLQSQDCKIEIWIEKDALSRICHDVAFSFYIPVIVARGFSSISFLNNCRDRVNDNLEQDKKTKILYFGDLDPSGWEMLPAMMATLQDEMNLKGVVSGIRCALTPEQVKEYKLPQSVDAMKDTDSRTPKFKKMLRDAGHPETLAVELDALDPESLEKLIIGSIQSNIDIDLYNDERNLEQYERERIGEIRGKVMEFVGGLQ